MKAMTFPRSFLGTGLLVRQRALPWPVTASLRSKRESQMEQGELRLLSR